MKQVIVVNEALKLPRGKLAAQVAHAALAAFLAAKPEAQRAWLREGMPKIVVKASTDSELEQLAQRARAAGLPADLIHDAGHTVVAAGTLTCLGIGPAPDEKIDAITSGLRLV